MEPLLYALNNPLKYVDPDGKKEKEYETSDITLFGRTIPLKISLAIDAKQRAEIKAQIGRAIDRLNTGLGSLSKDQINEISSKIQGINSLQWLTVREDMSYSNLKDGMFNMTISQVLNSSIEQLGGAIVHDSFHADQKGRV